MRLRPRRQPRHGVHDRGRPLEVQRQFAPADAVQMRMAVGEAGKQGRALQVDDLQPLAGRRARCRSDVGDPSVPSDHDLGWPRALHPGVDRPALDQQVLRRGGHGERGDGGGG